jgi:hypothetical protein
MFQSSTPESRVKARVSAEAIGARQRSVEASVRDTALRVGQYVLSNKLTTFLAVCGAYAATGYMIGLIESIHLAP